MGSSKYLKHSIHKHGIENFEKEILEYFDNSKDMYEAEKSLVNEEFVNRKDTYNLNIGGNGGWNFVNLNCHVHNRRRTDPEFNKVFLDKLVKSLRSKERNKKLSESLKKTFSKTGGTWVGKKHKDETKIKLKSAFSSINHQQGKKNSMYGKIWIHSVIEKRSIVINSSEEIPDGWIKGRKLKF